MRRVSAWLIGQGLGGIPTWAATDPKAGLLFIVRSWAVHSALPMRQPQENRVTQEVRGPSPVTVP